MTSRPRSNSMETRRTIKATQEFSTNFHVDAFERISSLDDSRLYFNRELSLLSFQFRVLEEAEDPKNPLLERFKFLSIVGSNMEEFFMVRVAGLKRQLESGNFSVGPDGLTASEQLELVRNE